MGSAKEGSLFISGVTQKVRVKTDEEGTEAAAVTEIAVNTRGFMEPDAELSFDRPFVYAIVDISNGTPLFLGVMDDPTM